MKFVKVYASPCNEKGQSREGTPARTINLSVDLIGAIEGDLVMIKGGEIIRLGSQWFKEIRLVNPSDLNNL